MHDSDGTSVRKLNRAKQESIRTGFSEVALRRLARARVIPHYRVGGLVMFDPADVDAYIESTRVEAAK